MDAKTFAAVLAYIEENKEKLRGPVGPQGKTGFAPKIESKGTKIRVVNKDYTTDWIDLKGEKGDVGPKGEKGDTPVIPDVEAMFTDYRQFEYEEVKQILEE